MIRGAGWTGLCAEWREEMRRPCEIPPRICVPIVPRGRRSELIDEMRSAQADGWRPPADILRVQEAEREVSRARSACAYEPCAGPLPDRHYSRERQQPDAALDAALAAAERAYADAVAALAAE